MKVEEGERRTKKVEKVKVVEKIVEEVKEEVPAQKEEVSVEPQKEEKNAEKADVSMGDVDVSDMDSIKAHLVSGLSGMLK